MIKSSSYSSIQTIIQLQDCIEVMAKMTMKAEETIKSWITDVKRREDGKLLISFGECPYKLLMKYNDLEKIPFAFDYLPGVEVYDENAFMSDNAPKQCSSFTAGIVYSSKLESFKNVKIVWRKGHQFVRLTTLDTEDYSFLENMFSEYVPDKLSGELTLQIKTRKELNEKTLETFAKTQKKTDCKMVLIFPFKTDKIWTDIAKKFNISRKTCQTYIISM